MLSRVRARQIKIFIERCAETRTASRQFRSRSRPYFNFEQRERNRQLPTDRVLELLKRWMPRQFELAEVVGKWVWIQFPEPPAETIRADLSQFGFHWNSKRQAWQHPCGHSATGSPNEPREKYSSYFPADRQAA